MHSNIFVKHKQLTPTKLHVVSLILLNALLPLINTLFPTSKGPLFAVGFVLFVLMLSGFYQKLARGVMCIGVFFGGYIVSALYLKNAILVAMFRMFLLFLPSCLLAWVLCSEYKPSEILSGLQKLKLPKLLIIGLMVTIRYLSTFAKEFEIIKNAMMIRGVKFSLLHPLRTFEYLLVPQLFRCLILSNELTMASLMKGITAPTQRTSFFDRPFTWLDFLSGLILLTGYGLIIGGAI